MDGVPVDLAMCSTLEEMLQLERQKRDWSYADMWRQYVTFCEGRGVKTPRRESVYQWCTGARVPEDDARILLFDFLGWSPPTIAFAVRLIGRAAAAPVQAAS